MSNVTIVLALLRKPNGNSQNHNCNVENFVVFDVFNVLSVYVCVRSLYSLA